MPQALDRYVAEIEAASATLRRHYPVCAPLELWEREADRVVRDMLQA